jgi:hypothetical protein
MAKIQESPHTGVGMVDHAMLNANFAAVNIPSVTTEERETMAHEEGQIVYDTDLHKLCVCAGEAWEVLASTAGPAAKTSHG